MSLPRAVVLVEIAFLEGTQYVASEFYVSQPGDTPASKLYDGRLEDLVYERGISCVIWRGDNRPPQPVRELRFLNTDGLISDWINYTVRDQAITIKLAYVEGNASANSWVDIPLTAFDTIGILRGDDVIADGEDAIRITLRSWLDVLNEAALYNAAPPFVVGDVEYVRPLATDEATLAYEVLDRPYLHELTQLRRGGTPLVGGGTDYTASGVGFTLNDPPSGVLQARVKGVETTSGGVFVNTIRAAIRYAVEDGDDYLGILDSSVDDLPTYAPCVALYQSITRGEFVQKCLDSINGFWWQDLSGMLRFGVLAQATGTPVIEITEDDIDGDLQVETDLAPGLTRQVHFNINFAVATDAEAYNAGSATYREEAKREYDFVTCTAAPAGKYLPANNRDPRKLWLKVEADAEAVAQDSCSLYEDTNAYFGRLTIFVRDGTSAANSIEPNDVVRLTHSRYGLDGSGTLARVVWASSSVFDQRLELILWWIL